MRLPPPQTLWYHAADGTTTRVEPTSRLQWPDWRVVCSYHGPVDVEPSRSTEPGCAVARQHLAEHGGAA